MENFNRSIELGSSQIMGLYKELSKLDPDSRCDCPCLRELYGEMEDLINEYRESIHDEVMNFLEDNLKTMNENLVLDFKDLRYNAKQQLIKLLALYLRTVEDNERVEIKMIIQLKEIKRCTMKINLVDPTIVDITPNKFTIFGWDTGRKKIFEYENIDQISLTTKSEYAL